VLGHLDKGLFSKRLGDIVEVSRLNGWHLPVRDLLALASNMILGHSNPKEAKEGLMACSDVAKIQEKGSIENASCSVPCDHVPVRSWPLFRAREVMPELIKSLRQERQS
jgi:hypothetical protein